MPTLNFDFDVISDLCFHWNDQVVWIQTF